MSKKNGKSVNVLAFVKNIAGFQHTLFLSVIFVAIISLVGCSSLPNTINPAEWYKNTVNLIAGEDAQNKESWKQTDKAKTYQRGVQSNKAKKILSRESPIPKLSSVPKRPSSAVVKGLVSDKQKRKYAEPIARQGEASQMMAQQAPRPAPQPQQTSDVTALQRPHQQYLLRPLLQLR